MCSVSGMSFLNLGKEPFIDRGGSPIFIGWEDVEWCLNHPSQYGITIIHPNTGEKIETSDKKIIFDFINSGSTFIICGFAHYNLETNELARKIQDKLDVTCDLHVYGGLKSHNHSSVGLHKDLSANYICQMDGETNWKIYDDNMNIILDDVLTRGDVLYIPVDTYHCAEPLNKRLSISIAMWNKSIVSKVDRNYYKIEEV